MIELLVSPWAERFDALVDAARSSLVLCSPYIGRAACDRVGERLTARHGRGLRELYVLTDLSLDNLLSGATDVTGLLALAQAFPRTSIRFLPSLHAKVYVADRARAVVTSANLTQGGLLRNFEYGVMFTRRTLVRKVREDVIQYGGLGAVVPEARLKLLAESTTELRKARMAAERSIRRAARQDLARRLRGAEDEVLRARTAGRAPHAIFADAVLHVLRQGPRTTASIHSAIRAIHPDLCDDSVDRVIDGQRFGKKWKHAVRTAQQHLKKRGDAQYGNGLWSLTEP